MGQIIGVGITLAIMSVIGTRMLINEKRRNSLFPDDGIVWNTEIQKRLEREGK